MPYPSLTFAQLLDNATREELEQFVALLQGYLSSEHKDDGSHSDLTADSVTVAGDVTATGDGSFDGTVTADADGMAVVIGDVSDDTGISAPGISLARDTTSHFALMADRPNSLAGAAALVIQDALNTGVSTIPIVLYRTTSIGASPAGYTLMPLASTATLDLGENSSGKRITNLYASVVTAQAAVVTTTLNCSTNGFQVAAAQTIASGAGGTYDFPNGATAEGILVINARDRNAAALFLMRGGTGSVVLISDILGNEFTHTAGTASRTNVYWTGSAYRIQNNTGASCTYDLTLLAGTGII